MRRPTAATASAGRSEVPAAAARADLVDGLVRRAEGDHVAAAEAFRAAADANRDLDLAADLRECRACLAGALLDAGREQEAADVAREVVGPVVAGGDARGGVEPGRPLLECGRVLAAVGDPLAAEVAAAAGRLLDERADLVGDPDLRAGFLGTPVSRAIAGLAGRSAGGARPAEDDVVAHAD